MVDEDKFLARVWERDDPSQVGFYEDPNGPSGRTWRFLEKTYNGIVWMDEYSELRLYSLSETQYDTLAPVGAVTGYNGSGVSIFWSRPAWQKTLTFEGYAEWAGRMTQYEYIDSEQGGIQYGNLTRQIESQWVSGGSFQAYRATRTLYYPNVSGVLSHRLAGRDHRLQVPERGMRLRCRRPAGGAALPV